MRRETDDYTDFEGGVPRKAPVRRTRRTASPAAQRRTTTRRVAAPKEKIEIGMGLKIIPLGGLEQIGMNITAFEYEDSIIVVDCGLSFPGDDMLGIDLVIPDVSYLKQNIDRVKGFVITHGHEDHIGALPYVLKEINVPVYATKLTMGLIENKLKEHVMPKPVKRKVVKYGQSINLGCFRVEFIRTNHSISDAAALAIFSPVGTVVHTGDFKVDFTPVSRILGNFHCNTVILAHNNISSLYPSKEYLHRFRLISEICSGNNNLRGDISYVWRHPCHLRHGIHIFLQLRVLLATGKPYNDRCQDEQT